jgi:hypothetical protein
VVTSCAGFDPLLDVEAFDVDDDGGSLEIGGATTDAELVDAWVFDVTVDRADG